MNTASFSLHSWNLWVIYQWPNKYFLFVYVHVFIKLSKISIYTSNIPDKFFAFTSYMLLIFFFFFYQWYLIIEIQIDVQELQGRIG